MRVFKMNLTDTDGNRITPAVDPSEYSVDKSTVCPTTDWSVSSIYGCKNTEQLIKHYHATLGSHPKHILITAARDG